MTYQQAIQYLYSRLPMFQKVGSKALKEGLTNIIALSEYLQKPHLAYPTIHIAGTNGKGSTAHLIAAILQEHGLKVGLYTSPHYRDFRERIKINGNYISENAVIDFIQNHQTAVENIQPSYFEVTVAMAFDYFRNEKVDIAVIETGLGGETDSTNIIEPILSVITNVSFDHVGVLGNTLTAISTVKSGIIKKNTPVVIGEKHSETMPVFIKKAAKETASITFANDIFNIKKTSESFKSTVFDIFNKKNELIFEKLAVQVFGNYQSKNALTTLASIQKLNETTNYNISETTIRKGFKQVKSLTNMIGRWDILNEKPLILTDSGHNEAGIQNIVEQLKSIPHEALHIVLGVVNDKDLDKMLSLLPKDAIYYFTKPNVPRGLSELLLKEKAIQKGFKGESYKSVTIALKAAKAVAAMEDLIFVGGSSFVVAEVV
ncbi:MAG: bifunctional folylpolyglutamate synthase/dihydrofolate synthase [Saprospiraceae bacterium]